MAAGNDVNPYEGPQHHSVVDVPQGSQAPGPFAVFIVVALSTASAAATFFCTCLGLFVLDVRGTFEIPFLGLCGLAAFGAFVLVARLGLAIVNGLQGGRNVRLSWWVIFAGGLIACGTSVCGAFFGEPGTSIFPAAVVTAIYLWKRHQRAAVRQSRIVE